MELTYLKEKLNALVCNNIEKIRTKATFDFDFAFDSNPDCLFWFKGNWYYADDDETKARIEISESGIQFPDFEATIEQRYINEIENYVNL